MLKIMNIVGARPNFMKIAPLMAEYKSHSEIEPYLVHTGQHYDEKMSNLFFHQLGIPVISDFLPSSFHIQADENYGFLAHCTEGWLRAFRILASSPSERSRIAKNAKNLFEEYYNPNIWAVKLYEQIYRLFNEKK